MFIRLLVAIFVFALTGAALAQDCIDYADDPTTAGSFAPAGGVQAVATHDGLVYSVGTHLWILDVADPASPTVVGSGFLDSSSQGVVAVEDGRAYIASSFSRNLITVDITDPTTPVVLGFAPTDENIAALDVEASHAYTVGGPLMDDNHFQVVDVSSPGSPVVLAMIETMCSEGGGAVEARGDRVFITNPYQDLGVVDVTVPAAPVLAWVELDGSAQTLATSGSLLCVGSSGTTGQGYLHVLDLQDPGTPVLLSTLAIPATVRDVAILDGVVYCATSDGIAAVSIADATAPQLIGVLAQGSTFDVATSAACVCAITGEGTLTTAWPHCDVVAVADLASSRLELVKVAPNPFNPLTVATFAIDRPGDVTVAVYDPRGALVRHLATGWFDAGTHRVTWNGMDDAGRLAASGTYLFQVAGQGDLAVKAVNLVK